MRADRPAIIDVPVPRMARPVTFAGGRSRCSGPPGAADDYACSGASALSRRMSERAQRCGLGNHRAPTVCSPVVHRQALKRPLQTSEGPRLESRAGEVKTLTLISPSRLEMVALPIPAEVEATYSDWTTFEDLRPKLADAEAVFSTPHVPMDASLPRRCPEPARYPAEQRWLRQGGPGSDPQARHSVAHSPNAIAVAVAEHVFMVSDGAAASAL